MALPELTKAQRAFPLRVGVGKPRLAARREAYWLAFWLLLPATLGLIVLATPIVRLLFEHGAFNADDTNATARALMWLTLALPAHVLVKALSPAFFAREDTMTPLIAALKGVVLAIAAAFLLSRGFGADGIAAAIALGAWSMAFRLIRRGAETFGFSIDREAKRRLPRIALAALAVSLPMSSAGSAPNPAGPGPTRRPSWRGWAAS